jgi:hypothetical protein
MIVTMEYVLNGFNSFSMCGFAGCRNFLVVGRNRYENDCSKYRAIDTLHIISIGYEFAMLNLDVQNG